MHGEILQCCTLNMNTGTATDQQFLTTKAGGAYLSYISVHESIIGLYKKAVIINALLTKTDVFLQQLETNEPCLKDLILKL